MSYRGKDWPTIEPDRVKDDDAVDTGGYLEPTLVVPHLIGRRSCGEKLPKLDSLEQ